MLSGVALLFKELFTVCSNGKIPNLKLAAALSNRHSAGAIYHHTEVSMLWAPMAGGKLRLVAKHWRTLAADDDKLECCLRKAWGLQKTLGLQKIDWATSKDFRIC